MAAIPVQIGRYKVLHALGQGAMGTVYLAEDPALKRSVAIKTVRGSLGDQEVLARFRREAEISARLNHPNIITIFDVGEESDLGPFLAMEFVDGEGLDARIQGGALEPEEALSLLIQAGQALEAIHQAGIVHRDVKPSNFMVATDGRLKLMDFGVARGDGPRLTTTAAFLGTPAYAAPESLAGAGAPTEAADRWALAVTAFEMLTGRLPFAADSVNAVLYRVVHEPAQMPEDMDPQLRAVFEKALAKDTAQRHRDVRAFLKDLAEALPLDAATKSATLAQLDAQGVATARYRRPWRVRVPKKAWIAAALATAGAGVWLIASYTGGTRVIAVYSSPAGARVFLDGTDLGRTPLPQVVIKGHGGKLRLEKPEYLPVEHALEPDEDRIDLRLPLAPYKVKVATDPDGAQILLDGQPVGAAPREVLIPGEGRHTLEVRSEGYEPWSAPLARRQALPSPIRLLKRGAAAPAAGSKRPAKVKKLLEGIFGK